MPNRPYGFARNRAEVAAVICFVVHGGFAEVETLPEALFHPHTLELAEES